MGKHFIYFIIHINIMCTNIHIFWCSFHNEMTRECDKPLNHQNKTFAKRFSTHSCMKYIFILFFIIYFFLLVFTYEYLLKLSQYCLKDT